MNLLPVEKRDAVQAIQENYFITDDSSKDDRGTYPLDEYRRINRERETAMMQVLTPEEFEQWQMRTTPVGSELSRRTIGMEPTDAEFHAMYQLTKEYEEATGRVYGRWRAITVAPDQMVAAEDRLNAGLREALGLELSRLSNGDQRDRPATAESCDTIRFISSNDYTGV